MKLLLSLLLLLHVSLSARDVIDDTGLCKINWSEGFISCEGESAEGQSSFAAKLSAKVIAQRNLLEVVKGVKIDSEVTVADGMITSDVIKSRVKGVIRGGQITSNTYDSSKKSAIATVKLEMGKDLLAALLSDPTQLSWNEKIEQLWNQFSIITPAYATAYSQKDKATLQKLLDDLRAQGNAKGSHYLESVLQELDNTSYSGVLIDVSDVTNFEKAMLVKLVDAKGKEIYPAKRVQTKTLLKNNTSVGYIYGFDDARKNRRVFSKPLEIKVKKVYKNKKSNLVLDTSQQEALEALDKAILENAKVILVLGD